VSDLVKTLITGFLTSIVLLFLVYWFWKLYDRPSKKQLELEEGKRKKRKEERMWRAIEAEMEREREQAEALALIERKKAEMRARAKPPSAGVMQNALATLEAPTEGKEYLDRFKPEISEIQEILVDEDVEQQEIDDSDVLLAPELVQVRQDEASNYSEMLDELLETESSQDTEKESDEESTISDLTETESIDANSNELEAKNQEEVDWDNPPDEEDGWAVGW
tara:strand:+ start:345 stop:1010 length:666 start_codon:yes stop_codon:yes gene_type:complete